MPVKLMALLGAGVALVFVQTAAPSIIRCDAPQQSNWCMNRELLS
jgi:hypothetical protein